MLFTYNSRRMIHELVTDVDLLYHFGRDKPNVTFHADWKAFFLPSPRTDVTMGASALAGQMNALSAVTQPGDTPLEVVPLGHVDVQQVVGTENGAYLATEDVRVWERAFSRYTKTNDTIALVKTRAFETGAALGFDRHFRHDAFIFEFGGSYVFLERLEDPSMPRLGNRQDRQLNPRGVGVWQHDWNREWSSNVDGGVVNVNPIGIDPYNPTQERNPAWFPIFGVIAAYTEVYGRAQFEARRQVTPNMFIAQNTLSDGVKLAMAMPLRWFDRNSTEREPRVIGLGSAGLERIQLINPFNGELKGRFVVARVDLGVGWQPRPGQTVGLRYEFVYQSGDTVADMIVPTFFRNTFYFTYALRWPEDVQVRVPRRNQSMRADRSDLAPIGAEPVVVDPAEELLEDEDRR